MVGGAKCHDPIGTWPCRAANGCGATHELECAYVSVRPVLGLGLGVRVRVGLRVGVRVGVRVIGSVHRVGSVWYTGWYTGLEPRD